jgi:hypothetical protein
VTQKTCLLILLVLLWGDVAFAQGPPPGVTPGPPANRPGPPSGRPDDHDDNGPVQAGYAVVTSAATSGLVLFQTFGLKAGSETVQAGILPSELTTNAAMFINSGGRLSRNLGIGLVNPGAEAANVTLTLRKEDGATLATKMLSLPAKQQISQYVTEMFADRSDIAGDFAGMLGITSTRPVGVIGLRFRGINFSTIPVQNLSERNPMPEISAGVGGTGAVLLPQFAAGGGWATEIVIGNTSGSSMTVRLDLFKSDGTPLTAKLNGESKSSFTGLTIAPGGVVILSPRDTNGDSRF